MRASSCSTFCCDKARSRRKRMNILRSRRCDSGVRTPLSSSGLPGINRANRSPIHSHENPISEEQRIMGFWDRFGRGASTAPGASIADGDEQATAGYRYLLKTAPPETVEQAHAEAFAALTPEQRRKVLQRLSDEMPEAERAAVAGAGDTPGSLARLATRAEIRQPGAIERAFGGIGSGAPGVGSMVAGSLLGSMA